MRRGHLRPATSRTWPRCKSGVRGPKRSSAKRPSARRTGRSLIPAVLHSSDQGPRVTLTLIPMSAPSVDDARREHAEALLHAVVEGTASVAGVAFFASLVRHLATALQVRRVLLAECLPEDRARSRA